MRISLVTIALCSTSFATPLGASSVVYRNQVSVVSLDRSTDLTYDPLYLMSLSLRPQVDVGAGVYVRGELSVARELTESNWTTRADETYLGDTTLAAGGTLWTVPVAEVALSGELGVRLATSKASRAQTLQASIDPSLRVSRRFDVLSGLTLGYGFGFGANFHGSTTAERAEPTVFAAPETANTGRRNAKWRLSHTGSVSLGLLDSVSVSFAAGLHSHRLYDAMDLTESEGLLPDDRESREYLSASAGLSYAPTAALGIGIGAATFHDQLASDGSQRQPLFNRFTNLYFDLRFTPGALLTTENDG